ncbi:hypothetical protein ACH5RR_000877 [Cinchona calisaya]|uniref:Uncharacterized protein n=1 Tax=Cinchona calisaya TaxID=153742 RepID=A0ABD3B221_9GENT
MITGRQCRTDQEMWNLFDEFVLMPSQHISKLGKNFECKCLEPYHSERWTVDMLLDHPFIVLNLKGLVPLIEELIQCWTQSNPFSVRDRWIVTRGLFSTRGYNPPHQIFPAAIEGNSQALRMNIDGHCGGIKTEQRQGMIKN